MFSALLADIGCTWLRRNKFFFFVPLKPGSNRDPNGQGDVREKLKKRETKEKKYSLDDSEDAMNCFFVRLLQMVRVRVRVRIRVRVRVRVRRNCSFQIKSQNNTLFTRYIYFDHVISDFCIFVSPISG